MTNRERRGSALGIVSVMAVLAACGTKEQQPSPPPQAAPSVAPAATTTTTTLPPPVWRTVRWGMTKDQVLAALPGEAQRLTTPIPFGAPTTGSSEIAIPAYEADGANFRVLFGFESDALNRIHLAAVKPGDATCEDLEKALAGKLAAPAARSDTGTSLRGVESVWKRPDQTITLRCAGQPSLGFRSVTLSYTPPS